MSKKRIISLMVIGVLLSGISVFATYLIESSDVGYDNSESGLTSDNVEGAINELYVRTATLQNENAALQEQLEELQNQPSCPEGKYCSDKISVVSGDGKTVGDEVAILASDSNGYVSKENFYVIASDETNTTLIAKYNLLTSNIRVSVNSYYSNDSIPTSTLGYGMQSSLALGFSSSKVYIGGIGFSSSNYWNGNVGTTDNYAYQGSYSGSSYPYVYYDKDGNVDSSNNIYYYLDDLSNSSNYKTSLENNFGSGKIKEIRLLSYQESVNLGCSTSSGSCPSWISNTRFWIGSAYTKEKMWVVSSGKLGNDVSYLTRDYYGIRPVIVISTSDIPSV